ncbi:MAG: hypothetical protein RIS70_1223 [Planctomycetota bacterium]|jgi:hypothetical protein
MKLDLDKIRLDGATQPRAELLIEVMEDYAEQMRAGVEFPAVIVFFDGTDYWLADGFHRIGAWRQVRPNEPIEADVLQGTQSEAQWYSYGVNKSHGLRRTREDRVRAIKAALRHPEGAKRSDNDIARHVGVSDKTVAKYRAEMESTSEIPKSSGRADEQSATQPAASRPRKGRDGRTINTAEIGKGKSKRREVKISPRAIMPKLGHSPPNPMIPLQFSPRNPHTAAATLIREFTREWVEQLIQDLNEFLSQQGAA